MVKVTIELELDEEKYDAHYGPGSDWWAEYETKQQINPDGTWVTVPKADSEYKAWNIAEVILEDFSQLFHDWQERWSEKWEPWWRVKIDGVAQRKCCNTLENQPHKSYCASIAGPVLASPGLDRLSQTSSILIGPFESWELAQKYARYDMIEEGSYIITSLYTPNKH
jgi:hypothetical protein